MLPSLKSTPDIVMPELTFAPSLLAGLKLSGLEDSQVKRVLEAQHVMSKGRTMTLEHLLPLFLSLKGQPFTLRRRAGADAKYAPGYFPFESFYRTRIPRRELTKAGRQTAKSTNLAARMILRANAMPYYSILCITPLSEQVRRLSRNYVQPFIETSPIRDLMVDPESVKSVLQRSFLSHGQIIFSYANNDAERVRGIACDECITDEVQNLAIDLLPVILETLSGSSYGGIESYAGTPKSMENTMQVLWKDSSQAEWGIKCHRCGYWNIPSIEHDLEAMIGPLRENISFEKPATICASCRKYIWPHTGRWIHGRPKDRWKFCGRHIPQVIMPMHYASKEKWAKLLGKQAGAGNTPRYIFENEVLGESSDSGSRLITETDLKRACCLPWPRQLTPAKAACDLDGYVARVLACDWGGGGEKMVSWTVFAVLGMCPDGKIDVIFAYRSLTPHEYEREGRLALGIAAEFRCQFIAHDYTGAGSLHEVFLTQAGFPIGRIIPVAYVGTGTVSRLMTFKPATKQRPRSHYQVDKSRSLLLTCEQIKNGRLRFFQDDYHDADDAGVVRDFLALVDEKKDGTKAGDIFRIIRDVTRSDDFAQAVNIGCCALWHTTDRWPDLASVAGLEITDELLRDTAAPNHSLKQDLP